MYEGWLYQPGLERRRVKAHPAEGGLQLETPAGEAIWPYGALRLEYGGQLTGMVAIHHGRDSLYLPRGELLTQLLPLLPPEQAAVLTRILRKQRGSWRKVLMLVGLISLLSLIGVLWGCYWVLTSGRDLAVSQIPPSWESELGASVYAGLLKEAPPCASKSLQQAVASIESRLERPIGKIPYQLDYEVLKAKEVNAFALPGGKIALHAALIAQAPSPEALAGVMAHEAEHVLQRHGVKGLVNQLGLSLVMPLIFGDAGTMTATLASVGSQLLSLDFSRSQESDADTRGLHLLHDAKINPQGMADFFEWMAKEQAKSGPTPEFLSSHPLSEHRQTRLQAEIATLPKTPYQPLAIDWKAVQAEAKQCLAEPKQMPASNEAAAQ